MIFELTPERLEKIKQSWDRYGDCKSCGWHAAFYEVEDQILPYIFDTNNWEIDTNTIEEVPYYWLGCVHNEDFYNHRGIYLYDFLPEEDLKLGLQTIKK